MLIIQGFKNFPSSILYSDTSILTKCCSLQQYPNILFLYFTKEKDLLRIKETNRMETKSSFYSYTFFRTLWGIKRLHTLVETNSHAIKAILEVKTE